MNTAHTLQALSLCTLWLFASGCQGQSLGENNKIEVWGLAYSNLITYPEHGLDSKTLVQTLVEARNNYPLKMTLEQIERVADAGTKRYRSAGYKFHSVYVPPQKLQHGVVHFQVIEATLGDVHVRAQKGTDPDSVSTKATEKLFSHLIGEPVYQPEVDELIAALKRQRGIDALAFYSRGRQSGEVRLNIKIKEQRFTGYSQLDNYGTEATGEYRLLAGFDWLGPSGRFDQLSLGLAASQSDEVNLYGYLRYQMPLWNLDNQLWLGASRNQFEIGREFSNLELSGIADSADIGYRYRFTNNHSIELSYADRRADYDSILNAPDIERDEQAQVTSLSYTGNWQSNTERWRQYLTLSGAGGRYRVDGFTGNGTGLEEDFDKLALSSRSSVWLARNSQRAINYLNLHISGQYTEQPTPSFEKLSITGVNANRGFKPGFFASDRGASARLEWHWPELIPTLAGLNTSVFFFADASYGEKLLLTEDVFDRSQLSSAGMGLWFQYQGFSAQLIGATEIDQVTKSQLEIDTQAISFQINWSF